MRDRVDRFRFKAHLFLAPLSALVIALIYTTIANPASANSSPSIAQDLGTYEQWDKVELILTGPSLTGMGAPNPFEIVVDVVFSGPDLTSLRIPAFYDGDGSGGMDGNVWKARFSPDQTGTWSFESVSIEPLLDGHTGSFTVTEAAGCSQATSNGLPNIACLGRLHYSDEHYLRFTTGPHWLKAGANEPEDILGEHTTAGFSDDVAAVDYLAAHGVNSMYIMFNNVGGDRRNVWPWVGATPFEAQANHERFDVGKLAEWESLFEHIQDQGIVIHFVFEDDSAWTGFNRPLYYREMIARFGHHNAIIWDVSEEYNESYTATEVKQFAQMITELDAYHHPLTVHHQGGLSNWEPFLGDTRFDLTSFQTGSSPQNSKAVAWFDLVEASGRPIPTAFDESTRSLSAGDRDLFRHIAWSILLGGANLEIYTALSLEGGYQEYEAIFDDMVRARTLITEFPFWTMRPYNELVVGGGAYVFGRHGDFYLAYLPSGGTISLDLQSASADLMAKWFDPRSGDDLVIGLVSPGPAVSFTSPSSLDWVLVLEPAGSPDPSPTPTASAPAATATPGITSTPTPSSTASMTSSPGVSPTITPTSPPAATGTPQETPPGTLLLEDDFERSDGETVGNGWLEVETATETIGLNSGALCVLKSSDGASHPQALHSMSNAGGETLTWNFDFDWAITGRDPSYLVFMQLGDGSLMRAANQSAGVGVNILWGSMLGIDNQLGWRAAGVDQPLATLSGPGQISVVADVINHTYDLRLNGSLLAEDLPFDNSVSLDTVRFFTHSVKLNSFAGGCFDNLLLQAGGGPLPTGSPTPTAPPASPTPTPTSTATSGPSPTSTSTIPTPTPVATPTPTSTQESGVIWAWNQADLSEFSGQTTSFYIDLLDGNTVICSNHQARNSYIGATAAGWPAASDYWFIGKIQFSSEEVRAGAVVYYQDPENLYQINFATEGIGPGTGQFRLRRFNNRVETQLIEDNSMHFLPNTWYEFRLRVETTADRVRFHLEVDDETGVRYLDYDDTSSARFSSGWVGLRKKQGDRACWYGLTVVSNSGILPTSTPVPTNSATPQNATPTPTASITETPLQQTATSTGFPSATPTGGSMNTATLTPTNTSTPSFATGTPTPTAAPTSDGGAIWAWNGQDLSEFSGDLGAFQLGTLDGSTVICSPSQNVNSYVGASGPAWSQEQDFTYEGEVYFSSAPVRAGSVIYFQDVNNLYKINLATDDVSPTKGQFRLIRVVAGRDTVLLEHDVAHLLPGAWYAFRFSVQTLPERVSFHLELNDEDGTDIIEFDDNSGSRLTSGRVGLRKKQGDSACWNGLTVYPLSLP